jgi:hypothetical protein
MDGELTELYHFRTEIRKIIPDSCVVYDYVWCNKLHSSEFVSVTKKSFCLPISFHLVCLKTIQGIAQKRSMSAAVALLGK